MKFYLTSSLVAARALDVANAAEAEDPKSWSGELPSNFYGPGDGCTESNLVAPGADTVTALKAIDGGALCETDVVGMATTYTKFTFTCGSEENPDKVFASLYNCQDATCGSCSDTPELKGYALDNLFNFTSMTTDVGHCFGWSTTSSTNETELAMMASSETAYQNFILPSTLEDSMQYWDVFFRNTCIGSFKGYDAFMAEKTADDSGSNTDTDVETDAIPIDTPPIDTPPIDTTPTSPVAEDTGKNSAFNKFSSGLLVLLIGAVVSMM
jgi:hypothetical protein